MSTKVVVVFCKECESEHATILWAKTFYEFWVILHSTVTVMRAGTQNRFPERVHARGATSNYRSGVIITSGGANLAAASTYDQGPSTVASNIAGM